jgi:hypothetical protein
MNRFITDRRGLGVVMVDEEPSRRSDLARR